MYIYSIVHGESQERTRFESAVVSAPATCESEIQTHLCNNGIFSAWTGLFSQLTCVINNQCGDVTHGTRVQRTRYQAESVISPTKCVDEVQEKRCNNGLFDSWSGSFVYLSCEEEEEEAGANNGVIATSPAPSPLLSSTTTTTSSSSTTSTVSTPTTTTTTSATPTNLNEIGDNSNDDTDTTHTATTANGENSDENSNGNADVSSYNDNVTATEDTNSMFNGPGTADDVVIMVTILTVLLACCCALIYVAQHRRWQEEQQRKQQQIKQQQQPKGSRKKQQKKELEIVAEMELPTLDSFHENPMKNFSSRKGRGSKGLNGTKGGAKAKATTGTKIKSQKNEESLTSAEKNHAPGPPPVGKEDIHTDPSTGRRYSFNAHTGEATWCDDANANNTATKTPELEVAVEADLCNGSSNLHVDPSTGRKYSIDVHTGEAAWVSEDNLPTEEHGLEIHTDQHGRRYSYDASNGQAEWLEQ